MPCLESIFKDFWRYTFGFDSVRSRVSSHSLVDEGILLFVRVSSKSRTNHIVVCCASSWISRKQNITACCKHKRHACGICLRIPRAGIEHHGLLLFLVLKRWLLFLPPTPLLLLLFVVVVGDGLCVHAMLYKDLSTIFWNWLLPSSCSWSWTHSGQWAYTAGAFSWRVRWLFFTLAASAPRTLKQ